MLRSKVPSVVAKRKESGGDDDDDEHENGNTNKKIAISDHNYYAPKPKRACTFNNNSNKRTPLGLVNKFNFLPNTKNSEEIIQNKCSHEEFIRKILNKPFKIPISNYTG